MVSSLLPRPFCTLDSPTIHTSTLYTYFCTAPSFTFPLYFYYYIFYHYLTSSRLVLNSNYYAKTPVAASSDAGSAQTRSGRLVMSFHALIAAALYYPWFLPSLANPAFWQQLPHLAVMNLVTTPRLVRFCYATRNCPTCRTCPQQPAVLYSSDGLYHCRTPWFLRARAFTTNGRLCRADPDACPSDDLAFTNATLPHLLPVALRGRLCGWCACRGTTLRYCILRLLHRRGRLAFRTALPWFSSRNSLVPPCRYSNTLYSDNSHAHRTTGS